LYSINNDTKARSNGECYFVITQNYSSMR